MKNYNELLKLILDNGIESTDRTGVGTISLIGQQLRYDLSAGFPAVTTKRLAWKVMVAELLFFMQSIPDRRIMQELQNGHFDENKFDIWKGNCIDLKNKNRVKFNGYNLGNMYPVYWRQMHKETSEIVNVKIKRDIDSNYIETYPLYFQDYKEHKKSNEIFIHKKHNKKLRLLGTIGTDFVFQYIDSSAVIKINNSEVTMKDSTIKTGFDYYEKNQYGGYLGAPIQILSEDPLHKKLQSLWYNMLSRVGNVTQYQNTSISPRWLNYYNFLNDFRTIPFFDNWLASPGNYELDKDYFGSNVYSRNTTILLRKDQNQYLIRKRESETSIKVDGVAYFSKRCYMESIHNKTKVPKDFEKFIEKCGSKLEYLTPMNGHVLRPQLFIDQLSTLIDNIKTLKNDPTHPCGRRLIMDSWNPSWSHDSVLGICHPWIQCFVKEGKLSLMFTMRSSDAFLGLPMNIASYALLTHILAQVCDLEVGELIYSGADVHIYKNHVEAVKEQLSRTEKELPTLWIDENITDIEQFTMDSFKLEGYDPHPTIKAPMAV